MIRRAGALAVVALSRRLDGNPGRLDDFYPPGPGLHKWEHLIASARSVPIVAIAIRPAERPAKDVTLSSRVVFQPSWVSFLHWTGFYRATAHDGPFTALRSSAFPVRHRGPGRSRKTERDLSRPFRAFVFSRFRARNLCGRRLGLTPLSRDPGATGRRTAIGRRSGRSARRPARMGKSAGSFRRDRGSIFEEIFQNGALNSHGTRRG